MVCITVCVGSSCHMRGSYPIIQALEGLIKTSGLEKDVELKASFCMGNCTHGVCVTVDDRRVEGVTPETVTDLFREATAGIAR